MLRAARRFIAEVRRASTPRAYDHREQLVLWDFRREGALQQWACLCDRDVKGFSRAVLEPNGKGSATALHHTMITHVHVLFKVIASKEYS